MNMYFSIRAILLSIAIIALFVSLIDERRRRAWSYWLWMPLGLLVAAFLLPPLWIHSSIVPNSSAAVRYSDPRQMNPPTPPPTIETAPSKPTTNETSTAPARTDKSVRPDWMNQPPSKQGEVYVVPVESGVYADPSIREQMLEAKMVAATNRYIDEVLYRQGGVADPVALDPDFLQSFVHARATSADNNETFVRLDLNQHFRDEVDHRYRSFISLSRIQQLVGIALAGLALLGTLYAYLRLTHDSPRPQASTDPREPIRINPRRFILGAVGGGLGASIAIFIVRSQQQNFGAGGAAVLAVLGAALGAAIFAMLFRAFVGQTSANSDPKT